MIMENDELIRRRFMDMAHRAYNRNIVVCSDFLDLHELHILQYLNMDDLGVMLRLSGGYEEAERQIAAFLPDAFVCFEKQDFPIRCISIRPLNDRFSEELTHRDYLGALMNLGIDRSCLGDILVDGHTAYVFCLEKMADLVCREITRIRHTAVIAAPETLSQVPQPNYRDVSGTVSSVRLDSVLAVAFGLSRNKAIPYIEGGQVFVNARQVVSNGHSLRPGDLISVRGLGKFRYIDVRNQSKKGKYRIDIKRYI